MNPLVNVGYLLVYENRNLNSRGLAICMLMLSRFMVYTLNIRIFVQCK